MADYWKSIKKKLCNICNFWIVDNRSSIEKHERTAKHRENVEKLLNRAVSNNATRKRRHEIEQERKKNAIESFQTAIQGGAFKEITVNNESSIDTENKESALETKTNLTKPSPQITTATCNEKIKIKAIGFGPMKKTIKINDPKRINVDSMYGDWELVSETNVLSKLVKPASSKIDIMNNTRKSDETSIPDLCDDRISGIKDEINLLDKCNKFVKTEEISEIDVKNENKQNNLLKNNNRSVSDKAIKINLSNETLEKKYFKFDSDINENVFDNKISYFDKHENNELDDNGIKSELNGLEESLIGEQFLENETKYPFESEFDRRIKENATNKENPTSVTFKKIKKSHLNSIRKSGLH